jgi:hypothetical protein
MWQTIERFDIDNPIWVLKYTLYSHPDTNEYCNADIPGAIPRVSCHGWYASEAEALAVLRHFPKPNTYQIEKVYQRCLLNT